MSKEPKSRVGQLVFTFGEEPKDEASVAERPPHPGTETGSATSIVASSVGSKPERKKKWHSLYDKVYAPANLAAAWERVRQNKGAAGADGMTIAAFARNAPERLARLSEDLRQKTYRPQAVRRVFIAKPGGGKRPLGIPTVRDRIVQQAILQVLEPVFEPTFSNRSHGFRPERGCATALQVIDRAVDYGYEWMVDADIQAFFDQVDHERLLDALNEEVSDGSVLRLIRAILKAGVQMPEVSEIEPTELGTPQGGPLSPLLANVYLHAFDQAMSKAGYGLVRYADDFVLFTKSEEQAREALTLAQHVLEEEWGLRLHPEKTRIRSVSEGFEFLGYHYYREPATGAIRKAVRRKSVLRFRERIRSLTPRLTNQRRTKLRHLTLTRLSKNQRVRQMIGRLNRFLKGWHWYFKAVRSPYATPFRDFDAFTRRRVRAAIGARHGRGPLNSALPNKTLAALGLLSLDALQAQYQKAHLFASARKG